LKIKTCANHIRAIQFYFIARNSLRDTNWWRLRAIGNGADRVLVLQPICKRALCRGFTDISEIRGCMGKWGTHACIGHIALEGSQWLQAL